MTRYWAIPILALFAMAAGFTQAGGDKNKEGETQIKGSIKGGDGADAKTGQPAKVHTVPMKAGKVYFIEMSSMQMDCYVRLLDAKGTLLEEDGAGDLSARLVHKATADGDYKIVCTSLGGGQGNYTLLIRLAGGAQPPSAAHLKMIGKDAPDFSGDFAVNGKPTSLADLEGKTVLLHFWEPRSSASAALIPRLNDLHKAHQAKGLRIVGLTFYTSDIGQSLKFDKESGLVKTAPQSDRQSDQKMLTDFAAHHKVKHTLLAMPKQDALDAFESYYVNGLPQVVLIDRKGLVRMIDINGEKGIAQVEIELKKLLAEK